MDALAGAAAPLADAAAPLWVTVMLAMLTVLGGGAGLYKIITARASARKIDAEGEKVDAEAVQSIVSAATSLVGPLEKRIASTEGELREQRAAIDSLREDLHTRDQLAAEHSGWDYYVEEKARDAGITLPPRPPLRPV